MRAPPDPADLRIITRGYDDLDDATTAPELASVVVNAALVLMAASGAVLLLPAQGSLRVVAAAGDVATVVDTLVAESQTGADVLSTGLPGVAQLDDALARVITAPIAVLPVLSAHRPVALLALAGVRSVADERRSGLTLLLRYAGLRLATLWDEEIRGDLVQERGAVITALQRLADTDSLTGVANRAGLFKMLTSSLGRGHRIGLVYLDLDGFKAVNDKRGHDAGDRVLAAVARRIRDVVRPTDVVARIGGDEFVVVARDADSIGLRHLVNRVTQVVAQPVAVGGDGGPVMPVVSCGIALSDTTTTATQLVSAADQSMYERKRARLRPLDN